MAKGKKQDYDLPAGQTPPESVQFEQPDLRTKRSSGGGGSSVYTHPHTSERVPSVTSISGLIDKSGFLVPWSAKLAARYAYHNREILLGIDDEDPAVAFISAGAANMRSAGRDLGSRVHNTIEALSAGVEIDIEPDLEHHIAGWYEWIEAWGVKRILLNEFTVWSHANRYAGTVDTLVELSDGRWIMVDYKTSKDVHSDAALQLTALKNADVLITTKGEQSMPRIDGLGVLHLPAPVLTPGGRVSVRGKWSYREIPVEGEVHDLNWQAFLALRAAYEWEHTALPVIGGKMTAPAPREGS